MAGSVSLTIVRCPECERVYVQAPEALYDQQVAHASQDVEPGAKVTPALDHAEHGVIWWSKADEAGAFACPYEHERSGS